MKSWFRGAAGLAAFIVLSYLSALAVDGIYYLGGGREAKELATEKEHPTEKELATGRARALWTVDDGLFASYGAKGLRRASENIDRLLGIVRKHGIDLIVVVYPWPDQIINRDLNSRQVSFWQAWAKERNVQFVNLFPAFISDKDGEATIREYFFPGDVHWNESGHRLVAESFLTEYERRAHHDN